MTIRDTEKTTERQLLLCAYIIAEYTTALDHLYALEKVGVPIPPLVLGRVQTERQDYARLWWSANHGDPTWRHDRMEIVVTEARAWVTEHATELDDVLAEKETNEGV